MTILAEYDCEGVPATTVAPGLAAGDITNGSLYTLGINNSSGYASSPNGEAYPPNAATTIALAITNDSYFQITITPGNLEKLSFTNLTFTAARGGSGTPRGYGVRSSINNYASSLGAADLATARTTWTSITIDLSAAAFQNLTAPITFRFYWYSTSHTAGVDFDTIVFNGSIVLNYPQVRWFN